MPTLWIVQMVLQEISSSLCDWRTRVTSPNSPPFLNFDLPSLILGFFIGASAGAFAVYMFASLQLRMSKDSEPKRQRREYARMIKDVSLDAKMHRPPPVDTGDDDDGDEAAETISPLPAWAMPSTRTLPASTVLPPPLFVTPQKDHMAEQLQV